MKLKHLLFSMVVLSVLPVSSQEVEEDQSPELGEYETITIVGSRTEQSAIDVAMSQVYPLAELEVASD